ncbi:hypothetical protein HMN09_00671400 [Mycena chlorophos]|uniref:DUF1793-domain-containing protein n=1 Tax=Mycena chlorophos TaxID=658473 RepID=A0A8H6SZV0_MYCCL|nr:hypothetical protein HMN09_00671400 [Mycena chlorophos]
MRPGQLLTQLVSVLSLFLLSECTVASGIRQTFFPPSVPLAVRSPVFNTWLDTRGGQPSVSAVFANDVHITGWAGIARVDQVAYRLWGAPRAVNASTWLGTTVTPTRTIFTLQAGPMVLNVTFLSPIEPTDPVKQSFPGVYVYIDGGATDGKNHSVQLFSDISAEWVSNNLATAIDWSTTSTASAIYHQVQPSTLVHTFQDLPEDVVAWHAIALVGPLRSIHLKLTPLQSNPGRQSLVATDSALDAQLATNTTNLTLTSDLTGTTGLIENNGLFPIFAHLVDLGEVATIPTTSWAVGVVRDPITTFQNTARRSFWWSAYATLADAINAFVLDFDAAQTRALALDEQITTAATAISSQYADLVALGLRQALAGYELTISAAADGAFNTSDLVAFMKDTGNSQRVNPTEGLLGLMPALMYLNASMIGPLIEPLLRFQQTSAAGYDYALPDLGSPYPSAPGNTADNSDVGVENSGNMLILALAHARGTGDGTILGQYYTLFQRYASFTANNTFDPSQQTSDSLEPILQQDVANITNLGVKGIAGLRAMVQIAEAVGDEAGAAEYASLATKMTATWTDWTLFSAGASTSLGWVYRDGSSQGLMYNLYADKLLGLGAFDDSIYEAEANGYSTSNTYGVALSSDSNFMTRSDWTLFVAAALSDVSPTTRDALVAGVHARASNNATNGTFSNLYNVQTGAGVEQGISPNGFATPAQGAMMAVLALSTPNKTISVPSSLMHSSFSSPAPRGEAKGERSLHGLVLQTSGTLQKS